MGTCWTCERPGYKAHKLDDRTGHVVFCELHSLEHTVDHGDPDALGMLADAFDAEGMTYDAYRYRFYAAGIRNLTR